jgi:2-dehydro-3-deoxygalactonokinase
MIAINWGSSNFRAYKLDAEGTVQAERSSGRGAVSVLPEGFPDALMAEVGDWIRQGEKKILMCGMVGARRGWKEAPYVSVPATFDQVIAGVIQLKLDLLDSLDARIVPGLMGSDECGVPEVMRGEETELFGCASEASGSMNLCLPGTHTKWVRMEGPRVVAFQTCMTGDLYKAILEGTILRGYPKQERIDDEAFLQGVERAKQPGALSHHMFGVRTLVLTGRMREASATSYLSGLLIGHEVKTMAQEPEPFHLIGEPDLCSLYAKALLQFNVNSSAEPAGAALRGLKRIAGRLAW